MLKLQAGATALEAGRDQPTAQERPEIDEGMKRGIKALLGSLVTTVPA